MKLRTPRFAPAVATGRKFRKARIIPLPVDWTAQPAPEKRRIYWWLVPGLEDTLVNITLGDDERFTLHLLNEPVTGAQEAEAIARDLASLYDVAPERVVNWRGSGL
jgi:hypothetical protein